MTTDQNSTIDTTVIEALRPQPRRYDVAIDNELMLSVLPNGVKTWTWVYDDPSDPHRKTLGIYPDMSLEDAKKSLAAEKSSYSRADGQKPEFVIRDGRIEAASPSSRLPIILGAIVAMIAIAVIVYLFAGNSPDTDSKIDAGQAGVNDSSPFASTPGKTDVQLPAVTPPLAATTLTTAGETDIRPAVTARNPTMDDSIDQAIETIETPPPVSVAMTATTPGADMAENSQSQATETLLSEVERQSGQSQAAPVLPVADINEAPSSLAVDRSSADKITAPEPAPQSSEPAIEPAPTTIGTPMATDSSELIVDSRVARGNLTTAVISREPIDDLGTFIVGNGEAEQTYYFFTELRKLSGQRVRHRWLHDNRVVAEIPFIVGEAWRWRVYSSKSFFASMTGPWQVQVILDDDTVIYNLPFNFTP